MHASRSHGHHWLLLTDLLRLRNQTGSLLLLFPTLWALVIASNGRPPMSLVVVFVAGVFLMRSAGVVINDWWDRDLDRDVTRTRSRPLASGALPPHVAIIVFVVLLILAAGLLTSLNFLTVMLAPIAVLLAIAYPLAKRVTALPQVVLGIAFGWGVIMAWTAVRNDLCWIPIGIFLATVCWAVGYDTIYALQDIGDDMRIGIRSTALLFGRHVWVAVALSFAVMIVILSVVGITSEIGWPFYATLLIAASVFGHQAWRVKQGISQTEAFGLFKQHAWVGALILAGMWIGAWLR